MTMLSFGRHAAQVRHARDAGREVPRQGPGSWVRPVFKLRISKFGARVEQTLKRRRWILLVHRLIS